MRNLRIMEKVFNFLIQFMRKPRDSAYYHLAPRPRIGNESEETLFNLEEELSMKIEFLGLKSQVFV